MSLLASRAGGERKHGGAATSRWTDPDDLVAQTILQYVDYQQCARAVAPLSRTWSRRVAYHNPAAHLYELVAALQVCRNECPAFSIAAPGADPDIVRFGLDRQFVALLASVRARLAAQAPTDRLRRLDLTSPVAPRICPSADGKFDQIGDGLGELRTALPDLGLSIDHLVVGPNANLAACAGFALRHLSVDLGRDAEKKDLLQAALELVVSQSSTLRSLVITGEAAHKFMADRVDAAAHSLPALDALTMPMTRLLTGYQHPVSTFLPAIRILRLTLMDVTSGWGACYLDDSSLAQVATLTTLTELSVSLPASFRGLNVTGCTAVAAISRLVQLRKLKIPLLLSDRLQQRDGTVMVDMFARMCAQLALAQAAEDEKRHPVVYSVSADGSAALRGPVGLTELDLSGSVLPLDAADRDRVCDIVAESVCRFSHLESLALGESPRQCAGLAEQHWSGYKIRAPPGTRRMYAPLGWVPVGDAAMLERLAARGCRVRRVSLLPGSAFLAVATCGHLLQLARLEELAFLSTDHSAVTAADRGEVEAALRVEVAGGRRRIDRDLAAAQRVDAERLRRNAMARQRRQKKKEKKQKEKKEHKQSDDAEDDDGDDARQRDSSRTKKRPGAERERKTERKSNHGKTSRSDEPAGDKRSRKESRHGHRKKRDRERDRERGQKRSRHDSASPGRSVRHKH